MGETKTYENLDSLLNGETPFHFGRMLYKYTDCGPWTVFIVPDKAARVERVIVEIRPNDKGLLFAKSEGMTPDVQGDGLLCLGFNKDGTSKYRSLDRIERSVIRFQNKITSGKVVNPLLNVNAVGRGVGNVLRIEMSRSVPATTREVYYESDEARKPIGNCIGISIGSIVEGSDVCIDPVTLLFPFTEEQLDETVRSINDDACAVRDWANQPKDAIGRRHNNGKTDAERGLDCPLF